MSLFPIGFLDELKSHASIVQIVQERVPLRRAGVAWKGLCPFHGEKTPSFTVSEERRTFKCFGCGVGGDVIKFIELSDHVTFPEAVRQLAGRVGLTVPEPEASKEEAATQRERETLLKMHEVAAAFFREQLALPIGAPARRLLADRRVSAETVAALGIGFAPRSGSVLRERLRREGFEDPVLQRSGLAFQKDNGSIVDRFRGRIMIPICRESGPVIAFGGRAMESGQTPKYLNSPETPIYVKGKTLYGLHLSKGAITKAKHAVMVEGYFDVAQCIQAGVANVVASSGTALTPAQGRLLKRFAAKAILSFDPDAAGKGAAARTSEMLVTEGFQVNVAVLPDGGDPDTFIQKRGGAAYQEQLRGSRPYLEYLIDQTAAEHDLTNSEQRRDFLSRMLEVAARIPDAAARDQFADRIAHKAQITEDVVRSEIRRAAVQRKTTVPEATDRQAPGLSQVKAAERGLIWALMNSPEDGAAALHALEPGDTDELATSSILEVARSLREWPAKRLPETLIERLTSQEALLVTEIGKESHAPALAADDCVRTLKRLRCDRERAALQRDIDRLQEEGAARNGAAIDQLWTRKQTLLQRIEEL